MEDRIGGTLQILGTTDYPVILTSLYDDTAAAGFDLNGDPQGNTYPGVTRTPAAGDWDSVVIDEYANTRNVAIVVEIESSFETDANDLTKNSQFLGYLAPDLEDSLEVVVDGVTIQGTTDDEKGGDETQRLGFEVQGTISLDATDDWDIYSFTATAGSEVWIDLDRTSYDLDAKVELVQYNGTVLASSSDSSAISGSTTVTDANGTWTFTADGLVQDDYLGDDFYGTNPLDPGMYVILPGVAGSVGTYFVRVSSENDTSGEYLMQVRLRQVDEKPGTTIRYADIRYADNGVEIYGQPTHSILAAEAGEIEATNDTFTTDPATGEPTNQNLGNLLESDLAAIGVSGELTNGDVDWFRFDVDLEQIQSIGGVNNGGKTWSTVFDIDYADGISRADTVMAVYRQVGSNYQLVYIGRDSNIEDDLSAVGEGLDRDDLSRGSFDTLDAYIGPVQLPATNQTYFVAVMSAALVPQELDQTFQATATNADVRLEPVNSVLRIVEDHIGFSGYTSGNSGNSVPIDPVESNGILDIANAVALQSHVVPYTFSDVVLYVASSGGDELHTVNPFTGVEMTDVGDMNPTNGMDDIAMRGDGTLMGQTNGNTGGTGSGYLRTISTEDAALTGGGDDGLPTVNNSAQDFGALAFRDMGTTTWEIYAVNNLPYDVVNEPDPGDYNDAGRALWRIDSGGGAHDEEPNQTNFPGIQPVAYLPSNPIEGVTMGTITGMEFIGNKLYLVDGDGNLWSVNVSGSGGGRRYASGWDFIANIGGSSFTGLTLGPQNLDVISNLDADGDGFPDEARDGVYDLANVLFASSSSALYAFTTAGISVNCFDTNSDGLVDSDRVSLGVGSVTGLAFSPLDLNLWHPTEQRRTDTGHGVNQALDNSRDNNFPQSYSVPVNQNGQQIGGVSFYFGLENWVQNRDNNEYEIYGPNAQYGFATSTSQQDLTSNGAIGNNYNTPGGAYGSLITDPFDLSGSEYADKPTLYFNYFLDTEGEQSNNGTAMYDSARVWLWGSLSTSWSGSLSGGSVSTVASTVPIVSPGKDTGFEVVGKTTGTVANNVSVRLTHITTPGEKASATWDGSAGPKGTLFLVYEWGSTTAQQMVDLINAISDPTCPVAAQLTQPDNDGSGVVAGADLPDSLSAVTSGGASGVAASTPRFIVPGDDNNFEIVSTTTGTSGNDRGIVFVHDSGSSAVSAVWNRFAGGNGVLFITFDPGTTTTDELITAVAGSGAPLVAQLVPENDGTDPLPGVGDPDFDTGVERMTSGGSGTTYATTGTFSLTGTNGDFRIVSTVSGGAGNNIGIVFVHDTTGGPELATWLPSEGPNGTLLVSFEPGVTTAAELVAAIDAIGAPLDAQLVDDPPNNGSGIVDFAATSRTTSTVVAGQYGVTSPLFSTGPHNDFDIIATVDGPAGSGIEINFVEDSSLSTDWNAAGGTAGTGLLTVHYIRNTTTALQITNAIDTSGAPLDARLIAEAVNDGSDVVLGADLPDASPSRFTTGGSFVAAATTGIYSFAGDNGDFEIVASTTGNAGNNRKVVFVHNSSGMTTASWTPGAALNGVLVVSFDPGSSTSADLVAAVNASGAPLVARLVFETTPNDGSGSLSPIGPLAETLSATTSGAILGTDIASAGPFTLIDMYNDFTIESTVAGTAGNDRGIVFVHGTSVSARWTPAAGRNGVLTVTFNPGITTAAEIWNAIAASGAPLTAAPVLPEPGVPQSTGSGAIAINAEWHLLATNNSQLSNSTTYELPEFLSTSSGASSHPRQRVQELFDAADWRQARVDLGDFAGLSGLKLRFDFSTAGRMPSTYTNLDTSVENRGAATNNMRNQDNDHIGFYIDDIIVGYAERGEMVTAANNNQSTFAVPSWRPASVTDQTPQYTGEYQLEIRRGTEYANNVTKDVGNIIIAEIFDTNARLIPDGYDWVWTGSSGNWNQAQVFFDTHHYVDTYVGNYRGDQNVERQQDELIIENNTIRDVAGTGILIDSGSREGTDVPQPGSAINFPVLNNADLVPGVVVSNNVIAYFGDTGISFSGDADQNADPVTPFGRIVNNTIVGTSTSVSDYGIRVTDSASPTILNNIITTTGTAISISGNSSSTVSNYNLFQGQRQQRNHQQLRHPAGKRRLPVRQFGRIQFLSGGRESGDRQFDRRLGRTDGPFGRQVAAGDPALADYRTGA